MNKPFLTRSIFVAIVATFLSACSAAGAGTASPSQRTATLAKGTLLATVSANGNIQAEQESKLAFQITGLVAKVNVAVGDTVKKGDVLAVLDTADAELALRKAKTVLKDAETSVVIAQTSVSRTLEGPRAADISAANAAINAAAENYSKVAAGPTEADVQAAKARIANAETDVRRAQANYDSAYSADPAGIGASPQAAELEKATNAYNLAKAEYEKAVQPATMADKAAAQQRIADARAQLDKARTVVRKYDITKAQAEVEQAQNKVEQAKLDVEQAQRKVLQSSVLAPFDGMVSGVDTKVGETAGTAPVITLVDVSKLRIDINVDEVDVTKVKLGQAVSVKLDSLAGVELAGKVERVSPTSKMVNGVVTYAVKVSLSNSDQLKPGMTANTRIVLDKRENVLLVPTWAIRKDKKSGKSFISFTQTVGDKTETTEAEVTLGLKDDNFAEVLSGATEGQVVVSPAAQ